MTEQPAERTDANANTEPNGESHSESTSGSRLDSSNSTMPAKRVSLAGITVTLLGAIGLAAAAVYVATFSHAPLSARPYYAGAALWVAAASITPIWLESLVKNGASFQLAVIAWRLIAMLSALLMVTTFPDEIRIYFLNTLMACYFVALPLESWLLARRASK